MPIVKCRFVGPAYNRPITVWMVTDKYGYGALLKTTDLYFIPKAYRGWKGFLKSLRKPMRYFITSPESWEPQETRDVKS